MSELSMVETLQLWGEAVTLTERGNYEDALIKFMSLEQLTADSNQTLITSARNLFNIGQTYFSLGRIDMAIKAFQESICKDKMLAIAHFMLGCAHLKKNLIRNAQQDFENADFFLRGNRLIDYTQLGLKYKLYKCEILCNRGIVYAKLGNDQQAKSYFLKAVESRVEPRHEVIEDILLCWQSNKNMTPVIVPSVVVFKPARSKALVTKEKVDYLGKSQVVAARMEDKENNDLTTQKNAEESNPGNQTDQTHSMNLINERSKLMKDLRKKETRRSLKKTPGVPTRPASLLGTAPPLSQPPRPTSPYQGMRVNNSSTELNVPPSKPLPPSPRSKSPVPIHRRPLPPNPDSSATTAVKEPTPMRPPKRQGRTVTFQLVVSRTIQVSNDPTPNQLSIAAAKALGVSEDSFTLCFNKDGQISDLDENNLSKLWISDAKPTIYCYEKK